MLTYIYTLSHPETGEVRYVGKSVNPASRYSRHLYEAHKLGKKKYLYCWIKSLLEKNIKPVLTILEITEHWQERERYWISFYRKSLTNLSDGGEGSPGYKHTEQWKKEASKRMQNNKIMINRKHSLETRKKMSSASFMKKNVYPVYQYDNSLKLVKIWNSVQEAAKFYNICDTTIYSNIMGYSKKTKQGIWKKELLTN